ncbi:MAG TPA: hypothetical protein VJ694_01295 [Patescibacteria group bacterium]|nr:hypothetical protein [Patescibacteria group bacterium]
MGHPMEGYYDGERAERARLWERRDAMEARLSAMPLSEFTFAQFADLALLADRKAVSERRTSLTEALDRLDAFLAARAKKPSKPRRRSR